MHVALEDADPSSPPSPVDAIDVYELGQALHWKPSTPSKAVWSSLRYFGGMTIEEAFPPQVVRS